MTTERLFTTYYPSSPAHLILLPLEITNCSILSIFDSTLYHALLKYYIFVIIVSFFVRSDIAVYHGLVVTI